MTSPIKRRKTDEAMAKDRNNSVDTSESDESNSSGSSFDGEESSGFRRSSVESTDEEYIPVASSGVLDDETQQYFPSASTSLRNTSIPEYITASPIVFKSSPREYLDLERSNSPSEELSRSSGGRYSDQDDAATEIIGNASPDEYRAGLVNPSSCNQPFSDSVVNTVARRIDELKRSLPDGKICKSTAAYVTQTFDLRGAITTVAEQLSNSRQMEKSLKSRLKNALGEVEDLRTDKQRLKRELRESNNALDKLERILVEKDDVINNKDMELFVLRNDLELSRRAQTKAEEEKKQMEIFAKTQSQYYSSLYTRTIQQQAFPTPQQGPGLRPRMKKPVVASKPYPILSDPHRYKYYGPNYKFNKAKATEAKLNPDQALNTEQEQGSMNLDHRRSYLPQTPPQCSPSNKLSTDEKEDRETPELLKPPSPSSVLLNTETGNEDCSTSRSDSPVELILCAEDEDSDEDLVERFRFR